MLGRQFRTRLDLFRLDIGNRVRAHQEQQKRVHDVHSQTRELQSGGQNFSQGLPWLPWVIQESKGPVSYTVELEDVHVFHWRGSLESSPSYSTTISWDGWLPRHWDTITEPRLATAEQSLCHSSRPHKSPHCYGVTVRHWLMGEEM